MASSFRRRGIEVVVDTTQWAEFDARGFQISDAAMERIGARLKNEPFSDEDREVVGVRVRELEGFDVVFIVGREDARCIVTIGRIMPIAIPGVIERLLKSANLVAIFRGSTGV